MPISRGLLDEILKRIDASEATLSRVASDLRRQHGPMSTDEGRYVIGHEVGVNLSKFGVTAADVERVRTLRADGAATRYGPSTLNQPLAAARAARPETPRASLKTPLRETRESRFDGRNFHTTVVARSRAAFVKRLPQDAVLKAFKSVNNRVKQLTNSSKDRQAMMGWAFSEQHPQLQMTDLSTESEANEQIGLRFMMQGAMAGMRNPRAHEDHWAPDADEAAVLDALAFASLLHRMLDRCEQHGP